MEAFGDFSYYSVLVKGKVLVPPSQGYTEFPAGSGVFYAHICPSTFWPTDLIFMRDGPEHLIARGTPPIAHEEIMPELGHAVLPDTRRCFESIHDDFEEY